MMDFTQDQARNLVGISIETLRHWRKTIPHLSLKTGKATRFSFNELVGLAVIRELVEVFGVHIGTLSAAVDSMFPLLSEMASDRLERSTVAFSGAKAKLYDIGAIETKLFAESVLIVPLAPVVAGIQRGILPFAPTSRQDAVPRFSPKSVRRQA